MQNLSPLTSNTLLLTSYSITYETASSLDKESLIDLLQHRTKLLLSATTEGFPDRGYILRLKSEVETLQEEIKSRKDIRD